MIGNKYQFRHRRGGDAGSYGQYLVKRESNKRRSLPEDINKKGVPLHEFLHRFLEGRLRLCVRFL